MTNSFLQVTGFDPLIVSAPQGAQGPQGAGHGDEPVGVLRARWFGD